MDWLSVISLIAAILAAVFSAGAWLAAKKSLTYQALTHVMRDYAKDDIGEHVGTLRTLYRRDCRENADVLISEFERLLEKPERGGVERAGRRASHFYQRVGTLHEGKVLRGDILYRRWSEEDRSIIPKIGIPLQTVLYEKHHGRRPTNQFKELQTLYED